MQVQIQLLALKFNFLHTKYLSMHTFFLTDVQGVKTYRQLFRLFSFRWCALSGVGTVEDPIRVEVYEISIAPTTARQ